MQQTASATDLDHLPQTRLAEAKQPSLLFCRDKRHNSLDTPLGRSKQGYKRRVRRIQVELPLFRKRVQELELQLKRRQLQQQNSFTTNIQSQHNDSDRQIHQAGSLWNGLAERQFKERLRVEEQQLVLKRSCKELVDFSSKLQTLFTKFEEAQEETSLRMGNIQRRKFWLFGAHTDDEVFAEQMNVVAKLYLKQKQLQNPCRTMNFRSDLAMGRDIPRPNPNVKAGVIFDAQCGALLPFSLNVAAEAYWKFFRVDHIDKTASFKADDVDGVVLRSCTVLYDFDGSKSKAQGKFMCQRHWSEDSVEFVWSGVWNVSEFGGVQFHGMQMHKRGFMKLRSVPHQGPGQRSTSTVVETKYETVPIFSDSVTNREQQTQAFIKALDGSFSRMNDKFCRMMSDLLLDEDWRATFGQEK